MKFYLVQYTQVFDPCAHTRVIITNDFKRWQNLMTVNGYVFSCADEIDMKRAHMLSVCDRCKFEVRFYENEVVYK